MDGSSIYRPTSAALGAELDEELLIMQVDQGVFFRLKDTGVAIWRLLDGVRNVDDIVASLAAEYAVDQSACRSHVVAFLVKLEAARLVQYGANAVE